MGKRKTGVFFEKLSDHNRKKKGGRHSLLGRRQKTTLPSKRAKSSHLRKQKGQNKARGVWEGGGEQKNNSQKTGVLPKGRAKNPPEAEGNRQRAEESSTRSGEKKIKSVQGNQKSTGLKTLKGDWLAGGTDTAEKT